MIDVAQKPEDVVIDDAMDVSEEFRDEYLEIVALTDPFCDEHLNGDYRELCRRMASAICQSGSPVKRGKRASWACGIVYAVGWVNYLTDPAQQPHLRSEQIAEGFGVSMATMQAKWRMIREGLDLVEFDLGFCLPGRLDENPMAWMIDFNGTIADIRTVPRDLQQAAYDRGLIPYIPADVKEGQRPIVALEPVRRVWHAPPEPKKDVVFQFKIAIANSKPPIWRRIQINDCTLDQLHTHIQAAFGWYNCHLHIFKIAGVDYGDPGVLEDGFGIDDSRKTLLGDILPADGSKMNFLYEYDFGDDWTHKISFEGFKPIDKKQVYPRCTAGKLACPPEDCGGIWGYYHLLEALADADHPDHDDMTEWCGPIDPQAFDAEEATRAMKRAK